MFTFEKMAIPDVILITPEIHGDSRGYFLETYKEAEFAAAGIRGPFVQDNESSSGKGVLRGLHFQKAHTQGKLVRITSGKVFDVAVDVRPGSATFGQYVAVELDAEAKQMFWVPPGFAHGFLVLSEQATFTYKCTDVYDPASEGAFPGTIRRSASRGRSWTWLTRLRSATGSIRDLRSRILGGQKNIEKERMSL